ncbi:MAG TPA: circadian clock KaiB family protein [Crinalium sp.]|jgi:circadian clock protein KaiB
MSSAPSSKLAPQSLNVFKGIALFTPGGDLVYCIDPHKRDRWHLQLCAVLQEMLNLSEPPHFLASCYTATLDRWLDPQTQELRTFAEASPLVLRYQSLLNSIFGTPDLIWNVTPGLEELCNPMIVASYRKQFPELWQDHDLVIRFEKTEPQSPMEESSGSTLSWVPAAGKHSTQGYVLRLYVASNSPATERILHHLHQLLERSLQQPYTLKVVDIYKHPDLAEADQIAATPTLVKVWPQPVRRIVGDLDDVGKILKVLAVSDI